MATQEERRTETIGKLLDATVHCLAELGYSATSTSAICKRAGVSQGALFNHFGKRVDVIVATTEAICARHLRRYDEAASSLGELDDGQIRGLVEFMRASTRLPDHRAWHEVMNAARTDTALASRVAPSLQRFETALLQSVASVFGREDLEFGVLALSLMHMFDSEAVTTSVYPNPEIEEQRVRWAAELLRMYLHAEIEAA